MRDKYKNPCLPSDLWQKGKEDLLRSNVVEWSYKNYRITYSPKPQDGRLAGFLLEARPIVYAAKPGTIRSYYADETQAVVRGTPYNRAARSTDPPIPACEESYGAHCFYPSPMDTVSESKGFWIPKDPDTGMSANRHPKLRLTGTAKLRNDGTLSREAPLRYAIDGDVQDVREVRLEMLGADGKPFDSLPVAISESGEILVPANMSVPDIAGKRELTVVLVIVYKDESESRIKEKLI